MRKIFLIGLLCLLAGPKLQAQTNTNRLFGVPYIYFLNTNALVFMNSEGKMGITTNNNNGTGWFLMSGSSSNQPMWFQVTTTNLSGGFDLSRSFGSISGAISTNVSVVRPGPLTNWMCFTNGILMNITDTEP